jgi:hypothetical protein
MKLAMAEGMTKADKCDNDKLLFTETEQWARGGVSNLA